MASETLRRRPSHVGQLLKNERHLPVTPKQSNFLRFGLFFSHLQSAGKTPKPQGQSTPGLAAPAVRGPEVKLEQRRKQPVLTPRPRGTGLDSPSG